MVDGDLRWYRDELARLIGESLPTPEEIADLALKIGMDRAVLGRRDSTSLQIQLVTESATRPGAQQIATLLEALPRVLPHIDLAQLERLSRHRPSGVRVPDVRYREQRLEVHHEAPVTVEESRPRRVFMSYVREDLPAVRRIAAELQAAGVDVRLDLEDLPGGLWMGDEIRRRVQEGAGVVACFSSTSTSQAQAYMNEELQVAIDALRRRQDVDGRLVPVRLDECEIPNRYVTDRRTLRDLPSIDLFPDWDRGVRHLVRDLRDTD